MKSGTGQQVTAGQIICDVKVTSRLTNKLLNYFVAEIEWKNIYS